MAKATRPKSPGAAPDKLSPTKPGRPPGSPNREYEVIEEIPPTCVKCGSTKRTRVPGSKIIERRIAGTTRGGEKYNLVRHTPKCCECGQRLIVRSYHLVDEPPPAPPAINPKEIRIEQVVEDVPYRCWCEARQGYVIAELFTTKRGVKKWRIEGDIIARLSALTPKERIGGPRN